MLRLPLSKAGIYVGMMVGLHFAMLPAHPQAVDATTSELSALPTIEHAPENTLRAEPGSSPSVLAPFVAVAPIAQDALQSFTPLPDLKGQLLYGTGPGSSKLPAPRGAFIVQRSVDAANVTPRILYYPRISVKGTQEVYLTDIRFLPGGKRALLKIGWPYDRNGSFSFYLLDLSNPIQPTLRKIAPVLKLRGENFYEEITYDKVEVSPDGRFVAFALRIDKAGSSQSQRPDMTPQLCILEMATGRTHVVAQDRLIAATGWTWTPQNTLLFGVSVPLPEKTAPSRTGVSKRPTAKAKPIPPKPAAKLAKPIPVKEAPVKPAIYEVAAKGGTPKLIALDAWRPLCSPDGKRIAFFGSEDVNKPEPLGDLWRQNPQGAALCVVNRDGSRRKALMRQQWTYPFLIWKPDSQALFSAQVLQQGAKSTITIREFEPETGKVNPLLDIGSEDARALPRPLNVLSPFVPSGFSNDGRYMFAKLMQFGDPDPATFILDRHDFLLAINTLTGEVSEIARFKNVWGYDWYDESPTTPATTLSNASP